MIDDGGAVPVSAGIGTKRSPASRVAYEAWVAASNALCDAPEPAAAFEWDGPGFQEFLQSPDARASVCGFLPDEVTWHGEGAYTRIKRMLATARFRPFLFRQPEGRLTTSPGPVLALFDAAGSAVARLAQTLADAVALSRALPSLILDAGMVSLEEIAARIVAADCIINGVADPLLGFAIDELAVRNRIAVHRLVNPGYSPLRYAMLGVRLPSPSQAEIGRLRTVDEAGAAFLRPVEWVGHGFGWFDLGEVSARWGRLFDAATFSEFWKASAVSRSSLPVQSDWLENPATWPALLASADESLVPGAAHHRAISIMTDSILRRAPRQARGSVAEEAMARWIRACPTWPGMASALRGSVANPALAAAEWVATSAMLLPMREDILPALRAVRTQLQERREPDRTLLVLHACADRWEDVPGLINRGAGVRAIWRPNCTEAFVARWHQASAADVTAATRLFDNPQVWRECFGAAGLILGMVVALRSGSRGRALRWMRSISALTGMACRSGALALLRSVFADEKLTRAWLGQAARLEPEHVLQLGALIANAWVDLRRWEMWQTPPDSRVARELRGARQLLEALHRMHPQQTLEPMVAVRIGALEGCPDIVHRAVKSGASDSARADLAAMAGFAFAWVGHGSLVPELFQWWAEAANASLLSRFLRAAAWQLTGNIAACEEALGRLADVQAAQLPAPFRIWLAALLRRAALGDAARRLEEGLVDQPAAAHAVLASIRPDGRALARGWMRLAGQPERAP